jgi:hypothetical protein
VIFGVTVCCDAVPLLANQFGVIFYLKRGGGREDAEAAKEFMDRQLLSRDYRE